MKDKQSGISNDSKLPSMSKDDIKDGLFLVQGKIIERLNENLPRLHPRNRTLSCETLKCHDKECSIYSEVESLCASS